MNVEVNGSEMKERIETLLDYVARAYYLKGEVNCANPEDCSEDYRKIEALEKEIEIRLDSIRRELDGEEF